MEPGPTLASPETQVKEKTKNARWDFPPDTRGEESDVSADEKK